MSTVSDSKNDPQWWRPDLARLDVRLRGFLHTSASRVLGGARIGLDALLDELSRDRSAGPRPRAGDLGPRSPMLTRLETRFGLDRFATDLIVLAVAVTVDPRYRHLIAALDPDNRNGHPSVGFAIELLHERGLDETWHASLDRAAPLRRARLLELGGDGPLPTQAIRLHPDLDVEWWHRRGVVKRSPSRPDLVATVAAAGAWAASATAPVIVVQGLVGTGRDAVASAIAAMAERACIELDVAGDRQAAIRDARWTDAWLMVRDPDGALAPTVLADLADAEVGVVLVTPPRGSLGRLAARQPWLVAVPDLDVATRTALWRDVLIGEPRAREVDCAALATRVAAGPGQMVAAAALAAGPGTVAASCTTADLERAARTLPAVRLAGVAERVACPHRADDLVVATTTARELELVRAWLRTGARVRDRLPDGHIAAGLTCLFHGPPGTGKTMAAQILAAEAGVDLFHVDLAQVVSKYIGETEKNLAALFDQLETRRVVLFFDEADALFGRRTATRDAHDRYANIETSYLLQRIDQYAGVVILATNLLGNIDGAFLRRLQVMAEFALPSAPERTRLWRRMLPTTVTAVLDVELLARTFAISGADIRNAIATGSLLASDAEQPLGLEQLVPAACRELRKQGRLIIPGEFGALARYVQPEVIHGVGC